MNSPEQVTVASDLARRADQETSKILLSKCLSSAGNATMAGAFQDYRDVERHLHALIDHAEKALAAVKELT